MMFSSPLPRGRQPRYNESSGLRSSRDQDATARQWIRARTVGHNNGGTDRQMFFMIQKLNRSRRRVVGGGATPSSGGMVFKGQYDPSTSYDAQNVVIFTPDGASAGTYVAMQAVSGISPDVGSPNWVALPNMPAGQFI